MTEQQMPARIWITSEKRMWPTFRSFAASDIDHSLELPQYPSYVRADIVERMAEALANLVKAINYRDACSVSQTSAPRLADAAVRLQSEIEEAQDALSAFRSATQDTEANR